MYVANVTKSKQTTYLKGVNENNQGLLHVYIIWGCMIGPAARTCIYVNTVSLWLSTRVVAHAACPFQKNQSNTSRVKTPVTSLDQRVTWDWNTHSYWTHSHTAQWKSEMWRLKTRLVVRMDKVMPFRTKQQSKHAYETSKAATLLLCMNTSSNQFPC